MRNCKTGEFLRVLSVFREALTGLIVKSYIVSKMCLNFQAKQYYDFMIVVIFSLFINIFLTITFMQINTLNKCKQGAE